jgi:hypothetical protein
MAKVETIGDSHPSAKDLFPNPFQRAVFRLRALGDAAVGYVQAKDRTKTLRMVYEVADMADRGDIDQRLNSFFIETRQDIYEKRQLERWSTRCEEVVDRAIGSIATQRSALRFLDNNEV